MPAQQERRQGPAENKVNWIIPPDQLFGLPDQTLWKNRAVSVDLGEGKSIGVGVYALPPEGNVASKFWGMISRAWGEKPEIVRMRVEPPVPMTDFQKRTTFKFK